MGSSQEESGRRSGRGARWPHRAPSTATTTPLLILGRGRSSTSQATEGSLFLAEAGPGSSCLRSHPPRRGAAPVAGTPFAWSVDRATVRRKRVAAAKEVDRWVVTRAPNEAAATLLLILGSGVRSTTQSTEGVTFSDREGSRGPPPVVSTSFAPACRADCVAAHETKRVAAAPRPCDRHRRDRAPSRAAATLLLILGWRSDRTDKSTQGTNFSAGGSSGSLPGLLHPAPRRVRARIVAPASAPPRPLRSAFATLSWSISRHPLAHRRLELSTSGPCQALRLRRPTPPCCATRSALQARAASPATCTTPVRRSSTSCTPAHRRLARWHLRLRRDRRDPWRLARSSGRSAPGACP